MNKTLQIPVGEEMVATLTLWKKRICLMQPENGDMICGGFGSVEPPDFLKEELPSQGWYAFCPSCKRRTSACAFSEFAMSEWKKGKFI